MAGLAESLTWTWEDLVSVISAVTDEGKDHTRSLSGVCVIISSGSTEDLTIFSIEQELVEFIGGVSEDGSDQLEIGRTYI